MIGYERLTKTITDTNGCEVVVCRLYGTEKCQIHKSTNCNNCPMFRAILIQLNTFEDIYQEVVSDNFVEKCDSKSNISISNEN